MNRTGRQRWIGRSGLAGLVAVLYLVLSVGALTCALHHGLGGACAHHAAAAGPAAHPAGAMPAGPMPMPSGAPADGAHVSLCHCLDNLAAEPPTLLTPAAAPAPAPLASVRPAAPALAAAPGPASPRGPPPALFA